MIQYAYKDGDYMKILCLKTKLIQKDFAKRLQTLLPEFEIVEPKCKDDILETYFFDEDIALVIGYNVGNGYALKMPLVKKLLVCPTVLEFERDILLPDKAEHNLTNETFALFRNCGTPSHFQTEFETFFIPEHVYTFDGEEREGAFMQKLVSVIKDVIAKPEIPLCFVLDEL